MGTHSSPVDSANKVSSPHWRLQILPVHCLTLQYGYSSSPVHQGSKRGGSCRRHQYSPVYRRFANENELKAAMPRYHPLVGASCRSLGWITYFKKSDLFPTPVIKFIVTIRPQGRSSLLNSKEIDCLFGKTVTMLEVSHSSPGKLRSL